MKMNTSIEWLLSFVIPEETSSLEEQIATLRRTLSKLDTLPGDEQLWPPQGMMNAVSSGMLKYMQSLDSPENQHRKEYILDALTVTELEGLLSLVGHAKEQLETQESAKSALLSSLLSKADKTPAGGYLGGSISGVGASPFPPLSTGIVGGLSPGLESSAIAKDIYEQEQIKWKQWNELKNKI